MLSKVHLFEMPYISVTCYHLMFMFHMMMIII